VYVRMFHLLNFSADFEEFDVEGLCLNLQGKFNL
jgi:hypothetical protein